jgi:excisionase family DNA binding protein
LLYKAALADKPAHGHLSADDPLQGWTATMIIETALIEPLAHQIPHAARKLGISRSLLYELIRRGELSLIKLGRRSLIADEDLRACVERHRAAARLGTE